VLRQGRIKRKLGLVDEERERGHFLVAMDREGLGAETGK
jgi:hypothetical protein